MGEDEDFFSEMQQEMTQLKNRNMELEGTVAASNFSNKEDANLIEYQLDTGSLLEKLEHFLKGDVIKVGTDGGERWVKPSDPNLILLNDFGVNSIMATIGSYVDKITVLSFYDEMRINAILADLGDALTIWVFCNYEKIGLDTEFKRTRYPLLVLNILHLVESTYRRALRGQTSSDINTSKIFTQSESMGGAQMNVQRKRRINPFNYKTW